MREEGEENGKRKIRGGEHGVATEEEEEEQQVEWPIFECHESCACGAECPLRLVQKGNSTSFHTWITDTHHHYVILQG